MQAMYDLVGAKIQEVFDAQVVDIGIYDEVTERLHFPYAIERGVRFPDEPMELIGFRKHVMETGQPLLLDHDMTASAIEYGNPDAVSGEPSKSSLFVPLHAGDRVVGVFSLQNLDNEYAFDERDVRLLATIGASLSVTLENARLVDETRRRNAELAIINGIQQGLAAELDMQAMYDLVGDKIQEIFDAQVVDIGVYDRDVGMVRFPYTIERGVRFPDEPMELIGFRRLVIESREPLLVNDRATERSIELGQAARPPGRRAEVPPLRATGRRRRSPRGHLAAEPRPRVRVQRRRRRSADDPGGEPERRPRERPTARRDPPARGRAGDRQQRRPGPGRPTGPGRPDLAISATRCA